MKIRDALLPDCVADLEALFPHAATVLDESAEDPDLQHCKSLRPGDSFQFYALPLYCVTRLQRPTVVIETGTQNGGSAQAILLALDWNDWGTLHSIDSGLFSTDGSHTATRGAPGAGISDYLKNRWDLYIGLSQHALPSIRVTPDLFFHDSDHSKACVEMEFRHIVPRCAKGALVGLHDHYGQWDHDAILSGWKPVLGHSHPPVHQANGVYHNVLRLWQK